MTVIFNSPEVWPIIEYNNLGFKCGIVAALAIVFYDYVLVLRREIDLIWRERWSITTILYAIARYLGLAVVISQIWKTPSILLNDKVKSSRFFLIGDAEHYNVNAGVCFTTEQLGKININFRCGIILRSYSFGMVALACTMHAIMAIRVFAMYRRSKKMLIFLIICVIAASASRAAMDGLALSPTSGSTSAEYILSGTGMCTLSTVTTDPYLDSIPSLCVELLFFLLASRVFVKNLLVMRRARPDWGFDDFLSIFFKDHLLHFSFYLISNVMEVAIVFVNDGTSGGQWYLDITSLLLTIQQCVLVPRLVISIREYNHQLAGAPGSTTMDFSTVAFASGRHESHDSSAST